MGGSIGNAMSRSVGSAVKKAGHKPTGNIKNAAVNTSSAGNQARGLIGRASRGRGMAGALMGNRGRDVARSNIPAAPLQNAGHGGQQMSIMPVGGAVGLGGRGGGPNPSRRGQATRGRSPGRHGTSMRRPASGRSGGSFGRNR